MSIQSKNDLVNHVAHTTGTTTKAARAAVEATLQGIQSVASQEEPLQLRGLGTFRRKTRAERLFQGTAVPAHTTLTFKPSRSLRAPVAK